MNKITREFDLYTYIYNLYIQTLYLGMKKC